MHSWSMQPAVFSIATTAVCVETIPNFLPLIFWHVFPAESGLTHLLPFTCKGVERLVVGHFLVFVCGTLAFLRQSC